MTSLPTAWLGIAADGAVTLVIAATAAWGGLALRFRASAKRSLAACVVTAWAAFALAALTAVWVQGAAVAVAVYGSGLAALLFWWSRLRPTHVAEWADDVAELTGATRDGDRVTFDKVRNFDWRSVTDYTPRWESRSYDLNELRSVDMIMSYWRGPAIAHMMISFGFSDARHLVFSVEIRRKRTQVYSELGGFFKEFEIGIIAAEELDAVRLRATVRGERVYLYRLQLGRKAMRALFLGYVEEANAIRREPRFYNTVTVNCTTLVYRLMKRVHPGLPLSYRLLFSGYLPEYGYAVGGLDRRWPLEELRARGYVSERARRASAEDFSAAIRAGVPGAAAAPPAEVHAAV